MSLLKTNEIQVFNGTTVTITATTTETSADLNVGADLDVTGALTLGTALAIAEGGTGATTPSGARVALDLEVGVDVEAYSATNADYADATANFTGTLQNGGSNVVVDSDIGSTVQAYDADTTKNDVSNTFSANQIISVNDNSNAALRITQTGTGNALVVQDSSSDSTPFVVDSAGHVGVSFSSTQTTPDAFLQVGIGNRTANSYTFRPTVLIGERPNGDNLSQIDFSPNLTTGNGVSVSVNSSKDFTISTVTSGSYSERMRIDSSGNVGIGTSSPAQKLDVSGNINATGALTLGTALAITEGGTGATDAATARTNLDVDQAGTDNSTDCTLVTTSHDYLSIAGQAITLGPIDLATDVTGTLATSNGGTGVTSLGSLDAGDLGSGAATDGYVLTADGAGGAAWEAASGGGGGTVSGRNLIINGDFRVNQRGAASRTATTNAYNYDRWYYDGTYLYQGVEDKSVANGTYTLTWADAGSDITAAYIVSTDSSNHDGPDSGLTYTSVSNGGSITVSEGTEYSKHLWIRFGGTLANLSKVQLEAGTVATPFERRLIGTELALCQRYYWKMNGTVGNMRKSDTESRVTLMFHAQMRVTPTITWTHSGNGTSTASASSVDFYQIYHLEDTNNSWSLNAADADAEL